MSMEPIDLATGTILSEDFKTLKDLLFTHRTLHRHGLKIESWQGKDTVVIETIGKQMDLLSSAFRMAAHEVTPDNASFVKGRELPSTDSADGAAQRTYWDLGLTYSFAEISKLLRVKTMAGNDLYFK
ncbi:hypothetical protein FIBSPDRAFT_896140 [Athelia psychrophila]|uniref:Uncharacterized protein n=1 Tax=Athelia psychrophila TaxID=1759441 RepID=A0A166DUL9_9AGAM|nr:hypothetical protein FIBSPDRAFT_990856 [Fibularhizoctonia sp. CBS 109695]KZP15088.1 hypothetical protein FIBSPDRAFT_896140 [Fibularhizoctonia sp. CBS 109695]